MTARSPAQPPVPVPIRLSAVWRAWVRARQGKTREIHAPDFADRVVHHVLVERLEKLYEPVFIHDSYANRAGRGSHAAVDRLQTFMRQRENMPGTTAAGGWYLQLDIHNFFNSIHRPTLYTMLCQSLAQAQKRGQLPAGHALALRSLCHKLLARRVAEQVRHPAAAAGIPPHKRLCNAAPGCGLPVGNLTSQLFANVYLNALDQFVKHTLKVRHYVRYVDDFVLLADSPAQLQHWHQQHRQAHRVRPAHVQQLQALLGGYWGHFAHANSVRLSHKLFDQMPWLAHFFDLKPDGSLHLNTPARWDVLRRRAVKRILKPEGEHL